MTESVCLANLTNREAINFYRIPAYTLSEIMYHAPAAAMVVWYRGTNRGDSISFVSESDLTSPFSEASLQDIARWPDVTEKTITQLIKEGRLRDKGKIYYFPNDTDV